MATRNIVYNSSNYDISYEIHNNNIENTIIFLHGWGSDKEIMRDSFSKYLTQYRQIYIDLPGFGNSNLHKSIDTKEYANIINLFLDSLHVRKQIIFGHSFGGKVATLLSPEVLVLLSTAGIPNQKSLKTKLKIKIFKFLKPLFGDKIYKIFATKDIDGMNQNMYETLKKVVNEDFSDIFSSFKKIALVYWGKDDDAVPLSNAYEIKSLIKNSKLRVYDGDHFFFLKNAEQICKDFREDTNVFN
jgi:pimeloyl-ACP methyl ester carboxylesterase